MSLDWPQTIWHLYQVSLSAWSSVFKEPGTGGTWWFSHSPFVDFLLTLHLQNGTYLFLRLCLETRASLAKSPEEPSTSVRRGLMQGDACSAASRRASEKLIQTLARPIFCSTCAASSLQGHLVSLPPYSCGRNRLVPSSAASSSLKAFRFRLSPLS